MYVYREMNHRITVCMMAGVFQNTAEQDVLEGVITSYFTDSLQSFVNDIQKPTKDEVYRVEDRIMKQLAVS